MVVLVNSKSAAVVSRSSRKICSKRSSGLMVAGLATCAGVFLLRRVLDGPLIFATCFIFFACLFAQPALHFFLFALARLCSDLKD